MIIFFTRLVGIFAVMWLAGALTNCQLMAILASVHLQSMKGSLVGEKSEYASWAEIVKDPLILSGWDYLDHQSKLIVLWDGLSLTGHELARFLIKQQVPVEWGSDDICLGGSCSHLYCASDGVCTYDDDLPGVVPVYLNDGMRGQRQAQVKRIAAELAHEAFHRMQPFGKVSVSQYEEYWAFYIDTQISGNHWPTFGKHDPEDARELAGWFVAHNLRGYLDTASYPDKRPGIEMLIPVSGKEEEVEKK